MARRAGLVNGLAVFALAVMLAVVVGVIVARACLQWGGAVVGFPCPFPCRAAQEVSVPDGSTPVGEVVIVA
jgi:hypothetical protein